MDTIFAPATARGKAGVAVIRISGPAAFSTCRMMVGDVPPPHKAVLRKISGTDGMLDQGVVITFPRGKSFTGEETVEFQIHGSVAITKAVLSALGRFPGLRLAEPGEFTRRALENNRLDLTQVEGLADLIDAETEMQRKQAQRVLSGAIGELAQGWRANLVRAAALLEATIDFADEDVPVDVSPEVLDLIDITSVALQAQANGSNAAERLRDSFEVAIVGPPNIGKSTLLNRLAGRDAAITSEIAGTTRDVIEVRMDLEGLPVTILDTAGLRETDDVVEKMGVERTRLRAAAADLRVFLIEAETDRVTLKIGDDDLVYHGKGDTLSWELAAISGTTGLGVDGLMSSIVAKLQDRVASASLMTRERHRVALNAGLLALSEARIDVEEGPDRAEFAAESLRIAIRALDSLVGRVGVEDILDEVFASFCLGK